MNLQPTIPASLGPALLIALLTACATSPPPKQDNLCRIFEHEPKWYDYARDSAHRWGIPIELQMAIVQRESSFRARVRPERNRLFGIIPWRRPSSAKGYSQAQDPAWQDYRKATGRHFARRANMADALDFIGWYNATTHQQLGIARDDAYNLYLAYHEGRGGYRRGTWKNKPKVRETASQVASRAATYGEQLKHCEDNLRCRHWWQFWPFCQ